MSNLFGAVQIYAKNYAHAYSPEMFKKLFEYILTIKAENLGLGQIFLIFVSKGVLAINMSNLSLLNFKFIGDGGYKPSKTDLEQIQMLVVDSNLVYVVDKMLKGQNTLQLLRQLKSLEDKIERVVRNVDKKSENEDDEEEEEGSAKNCFFRLDV